jgi:hypothetical protein
MKAAPTVASWVVAMADLKAGWLDYARAARWAACLVGKWGESKAGATAALMGWRSVASKDVKWADGWEGVWVGRKGG